jgi:hypothetical protein
LAPRYLQTAGRASLRGMIEYHLLALTRWSINFT